MGSFNVGCGISNLSINDGDEVGFVILDKGGKYDPTSLFANETYLVNPSPTSYTYSTDLFSPFFPPVFGSYNGFGGVEDVNPSLTTNVLESIFGADIEKILLCISCDRDIYSSSSMIFEQFFIENNIFGAYSVSLPDQLSSIGFSLSDSLLAEESSYSFEQFILSYNSIKNQWKIVDTKSPQKIYKPFDAIATVDGLMSLFGEATGIYPGFHPKDYWTIRTLHRLGGMFFLKKVFKEMKKYRKADGVRVENHGNITTKSFHELIAEVERLNNQPLWDTSFGGNRAARWMEANTAIPVEFYKYLAPYKESKEFSQLTNLYYVMDSVNRMFMPTFAGSRWGNNEAISSLNNIVEKISIKRQKEYADYDNDDSN